MTGIELASWSFPVLLALIFIRVPIGLAMAVCGLVGAYFIYGSHAPILNQLKQVTYSTFSNYNLSVIPLFLLMGQFAALGGLSQALFKAAEAWVGHRKGGVAMAAIGACAGFGAICGSSLATAATMGQVALPELKRAGYSGALSTATLAAGGTLGILIPPSVVLVIYAILTEQNIAKLFLAAFIPGILAAVGYIIVISLYVRLKPGSAGSMPPMPMAERWKATFKVWPVLVIFLAVVGGIYTGIFTPTEGAAVGAFGTGVAAWAAGGINAKTLRNSIYGTAIATGMIFMIVLGAGLYNTFADHRAGGVPAAGLRDGLAVHDPADHPDLLPDDHGPGLWHEPGRNGHLVRHSGVDRGGGGSDHTARGHEPVRHQQHGQGHAHRADLPWRDTLRHQRPGAHGHPGGVPGHHAHCAAHDVLSLKVNPTDQMTRICSGVF